VAAVVEIGIYVDFLAAGRFVPKMKMRNKSAPSQGPVHEIAMGPAGVPGR
jgi:hypothetical protein